MADASRAAFFSENAARDAALEDSATRFDDRLPLYADSQS
jgi:hypothetical protein